MNMTGNKETVRQLLRGCRETFRTSCNDGIGELLKMYEILFSMCRSARIVDEEGLRILGEHQDEWLRFASDAERLSGAINNLFDVLRDALKGSWDKDAESVLSEFHAAFDAEKFANTLPCLRNPTTTNNIYLTSPTMKNISINVPGNNAQFNIAQEGSTINATQLNGGGDWSMIAAELTRLRVAADDIAELKDILAKERPVAKDKFGPKINQWIAKIVVKASQGLVDLSMSTASNVLAALICKYYGMM